MSTDIVRTCSAAHFSLTQAALGLPRQGPWAYSSVVSLDTQIVYLRVQSLCTRHKQVCPTSSWTLNLILVSSEEEGISLFYSKPKCFIIKMIGKLTWKCLYTKHIKDNETKEHFWWGHACVHTCVHSIRSLQLLTIIYLSNIFLGEAHVYLSTKEAEGSGFEFQDTQVYTVKYHTLNMHSGCQVSPASTLLQQISHPAS